MNHGVFGAMLVGLTAVVLGACDPTPSGSSYGGSSYGPGYGSNDPCGPYATCGSCTPVVGCGWCTEPSGNGLCASDPSVCQGGAVWTWNANGCPPWARGVDAGAPNFDARATDVFAEASPAETDDGHADATPTEAAAADAVEADGLVEATGAVHVDDATPGDDVVSDATGIASDGGLADTAVADAEDAGDGAPPDGASGAGVCTANDGSLCGRSEPYGFTCRSVDPADANAFVPAPAPSLGCAVVTVSTPVGTLFYCCPHAP